MTSGRTQRTPEKDDIFFNYFAETANVSAACAITGYARRSVYEWRVKDPEFAKRWEIADKLATSKLEEEAYNRAVFGVTRHEPIMHRGKIVATKEITEYSDTLAIFLLKARDPAKYREKIDVNVNWQLELKQAGVDPQLYMQQMIEAAKQKLLEVDNSDVIEGELVKDAIRAVDET
jgi:hypothetical protein